MKLMLMSTFCWTFVPPESCCPVWVLRAGTLLVPEQHTQLIFSQSLHSDNLHSRQYPAPVMSGLTVYWLYRRKQRSPLRPVSGLTNKYPPVCDFQKTIAKELTATHKRPAPYPRVCESHERGQIIPSVVDLASKTSCAPLGDASPNH